VSDCIIYFSYYILFRSSYLSSWNMLIWNKISVLLRTEKLLNFLRIIYSILLGTKCISLLLEKADCLWGPASLLFNGHGNSFLGGWVREGVMRLEREFGHSHLSRTEVKRGWIHISSPLLGLHEVERAKIHP